LDKAEAWLDHWEDESEGRRSKIANGRRGDLSKAIGRRESNIHGRRQDIQYVE
jgi:hypothetical protein